jgi:valyl-tRNA synthetase
MNNARGNADSYARAATTPDKVGVEGLEQKWGASWDSSKTYSFDKSAPKSQIF